MHSESGGEVFESDILHMHGVGLDIGIASAAGPASASASADLLILPNAKRWSGTTKPDVMTPVEWRGIGPSVREGHSMAQR